jgi:hypothetical protein
MLRASLSVGSFTITRRRGRWPGRKVIEAEAAAGFDRDGEEGIGVEAHGEKGLGLERGFRKRG